MNAKKIFKNPKIAVIPGDGIGKEVIPEGVRALEAANRSSALVCNLTILILQVVTTISNMAR